MTRKHVALLSLLLCCVLIAAPATAADTEFDADYTPAGPVVTGQELTVSQNIFVGERFRDSYTLEFDTDLTDPLWEIALVVQNRTTRTWELPYAHATISGFTISTAERETWLVTNLTGTPSQYDEGKEITLWQMKVKMANDATKETFISKPVKVTPAPVPTAGPLPSSTATTAPQTTATTLPATTLPTTPAPSLPTAVTTVPTTPPATPQSSFGGCISCLAAGLGILLLWRR
ncbi:hypothetical protein O0S10_04030 [Methanocorpusculum sp. MG]|uniref:Uncharacterized protein n=1 Tax=Methanocorpusculum petauri TaxID=3002863 RepID=A0ABT4IF95_9EURY|nr:hypothetical protein [Methanocorpusculum petauri]MCZ0860398.1 hypothetical protein [Methanocorpusculum petauri]